MSTEKTEVAHVEQILDGLTDPSSTDVVLATMGQSERAIAAVAAQRAGGGGGSQPIQTGEGSPVDTVTPTATGYVYIDTDNGALYLAIGPTDADWIVFGNTGLGGSTGSVPGVELSADGLAVLAGLPNTEFDGRAYFGDAYSQWNGNGNGLYWTGDGSDGAQELTVKTGATGEYTGTLQDADGNLVPANTLDAANIPTTDPGGGLVWLDNGTLRVGADVGAAYAVAALDATLEQGNVSGVLNVQVARWQRVGRQVHARVYLHTTSNGQEGEDWLMMLPSDLPGMQYVGGGSSPTIVGVALANANSVFPTVLCFANGAREVRFSKPDGASLGQAGATDRMVSGSDINALLSYEAA